MVLSNHSNAANGLVNALRASFNESSQRGVRAWRVSKSPLRALRDSQTLGELSNSQKARGPASKEEEDAEAGPVPREFYCRKD